MTYTAKRGNEAERDRLRIGWESGEEHNDVYMYNQDTEGNQAEEFVIDKSGASLGRYTHRWDASGRCIEVKSYAPDEGFTEFLSEGEGDMQDRISYSYDEYGNTVREI